MNIKAGIGLLKDTFNNWTAHKAPRMGASVAFYSLLSFAPLLVLIAAVIALVFTKETAHKDLVDQARQMMGTRGADIVNSLLVNAQKPSSGIVASVIAFLTLLFGASGVFIELRDALNTIWDKWLLWLSSRVLETRPAAYAGTDSQRPALHGYGRDRRRT